MAPNLFAGRIGQHKNRGYAPGQCLFSDGAGTV